MKRKLIILLGTMALAIMPVVYSAAQEMDESKDIDEASGWQSERPGGKMDKDEMRMMRGPGGKGDMRGMRGIKERGGLASMSEDETLSVIKKHDSVFAEKLAGFKTVSPVKYKMMIVMAGRMLSGARFEADENMEKDAVRGLSLEFDSKELGLKYDKAADAAKPAIKAELKTKVAELFDLRLKGQEMRIKMMEEELARLKKRVGERKINKAKIVDERLGQLLGEGYGW